MKTVYKYKIPYLVNSFVKVPMPAYAEILSIQIQGGDLCLWAKVEPGLSNEYRYFHIVGTGYSVPDNTQYLATIQDGSYVWHVFEQKGHDYDD